MKKVIGFGDMLISFSPEGYRRFIQADSMEINYTGAEANVLVSLSQFGVPTSFVTRLPDNAIADCALACMRKYGVATDLVVRGGERMGAIYTEKGAAQRPSRVVYDRKYTAIATAKPENFDWDKILEDACWFHFTGITAALGEHLPAILTEACEAAKTRNIPISCDLNYRKNLWTEAQAKVVMEKLVRYADVLVANEEDADKALGIRAGHNDVTTGKLDRDGYREVAQKIRNAYGVKKVGITLRESISASDNNWSVMLSDESGHCFSRKYPIHIVNRVGGGDSFSAALIYTQLNGYETQAAAEFAAAASCLKHSIELDFNLVTISEVQRLAGGNASGRVQR